MSAMQADCVLTERLGLSTGPAVICEALRVQRRRFIATLRSFGPADWAAASRCSAWSVHDVARHVADVAELNIGRITKSNLDRFTRHGPFHVVATPIKWLEDTTGQRPEETVEILARRSDDEYECFSRRIEENDDGQLLGALGRMTQWSVQALHVYWDAWTHERDITIPLGLDVRSSTDELRLMTLYSLLVATQPTVINGEDLRESLALQGSPNAVYHIDGDSDDIRVAAGTSRPPGVIEGDLDAVLDSLSGRGPRPADLLAGPADAAEKLSRLAAIATGAAPISARTERELPGSRPR